MVLCIIFLMSACENNEEPAHDQSYSYPKNLLWAKTRAKDILTEANESGKLTSEELNLLRDCAIAQILKDAGKAGVLALPDGRLAMDVIEPYRQIAMEGRKIGVILDEARMRRSQWFASQEEDRLRRNKLQKEGASVFKLEKTMVFRPGMMNTGYPVVYGRIRNITNDKNIEELTLRLNCYEDTELVDVKLHNIVPGSNQDASLANALGPGQVLEFHQTSLSGANRVVVEVESLVVR